MNKDKTKNDVEININLISPIVINNIADCIKNLIGENENKVSTKKRKASIPQKDKHKLRISINKKREHIAHVPMEKGDYYKNFVQRLVHEDKTVVEIRSMVKKELASTDDEIPGPDESEKC